MTNNPLHTEFCGLQMASPIVLLSGCVGFGEEYTRVEGFSNAHVGAVCLKGTTGDAADLCFIVHDASHAAIVNTLDALAELDSVSGTGSVIRLVAES